MSTILKKLNPDITKYRDRRFDGDEEDWGEAVVTSTTVYIGNLSFFTTEEQIFEVFSQVGDVRRIVMGLDREKRTPCGFCFVVYGTRQQAEECVKYINATVLDDRIIRVDHDWGFVEGRQFGRGRSGGQVRDEYRQDYDPDRGGFGRQVQEITAPVWAMDASEAVGEMFENGGLGDARFAKQPRVHEEQRNPRFRDHASDDEGGM